MKKSPGYRASANQSLTRLSLPSIIPDNNPVSPKDGSHKNLMQLKTYTTALAVFCSTAGSSYSQEIKRDCQSSQNFYRVVYVNNDIEKDSIIELTSRDNLSLSADSRHPTHKCWCRRWSCCHWRRRLGRRCRTALSKPYGFIFKPSRTLVVFHSHNSNDSFL